MFHNKEHIRFLLRRRRRADDAYEPEAFHIPPVIITYVGRHSRCSFRTGLAIVPPGHACCARSCLACKRTRVAYVRDLSYLKRVTLDSYLR